MANEVSVNKLGGRQGWEALVEQPVCGSLLRNLRRARVNMSIYIIHTIMIYNSILWCMAGVVQL